MNSFNDVREINTSLCKIVGLDPQLVSAFSLHVSAAEMPRLVVTRFLLETCQQVEESFVLTTPSPRLPVDFMDRLNSDIEHRAKDAHEQIRAAFARSRKKLLGRHADLYKGARHA